MTEPVKSPYLECGKIINTHGCRGGLKVEPWSDSPDDLCGLGRVFLGQGSRKREMKIHRASVLGGRFLLLELENVTDMDAAEALRGETLYALREDFHLEAGKYFLADVIGLPVLDARAGREGQTLGTVADVLSGAASPIYVVNTPTGQVLVPGVPAFIKEVVPSAYVRMEPIDGMFDGTGETVDGPDEEGEADQIAPAGSGVGGRGRKPAMLGGKGNGCDSIS
jgi:16S rRNA processing protein RimM